MAFSLPCPFLGFCRALFEGIIARGSSILEHRYPKISNIAWTALPGRLFACGQTLLGAAHFLASEKISVIR